VVVEEKRITLPKILAEQTGSSVPIRQLDLLVWSKL
jgi:hypothetical protein